MLLLWFGLTRLLAQPDQPLKESPHLRINPERICAMQTASIAATADAKADRAGNLYVCGYFSQELHQSSEALTGYLDQYAGTGLYLAKYTPQGKLLWVVHSLQNARSTAISITPKGEVWLGGMFYANRVQVVNAQHDTFAIQLAPNVYNAAFAMQFSPEGQLLTHHLFDGYELRGFTTDKQNNLYFAGNLEYRTYKAPSSVRRRFQLFKANNKGQVLWQLLGDTIGQSFVTGIAIGPKNTLIAALCFEQEMTLNGRVFKRDAYQHGAVLASLNINNGSTKWIKDTLDGRIWEYSGAVAVTPKGVIYAGLGYQYNPGALLALKPDGALLWSNYIRGYSSYPTFGISCTEKGDVYLYGNGYDGLFGSKGPQLFNFKAKTSTDVFIASYNNKGILQWLKAAGGDGTDYCSAVVVAREHVWMYGHTWGLQMPFKDSVTASNKSIQIWLAQFRADKLAVVDNSAEAPPRPPTPPFTLNSSQCNCIKNNETYDNGFTPSLNSLVADAAYFERLAWWKKPDWHYWLQHTFFDHFYNHADEGFYYYHLNLSIAGKLEVQHPKHLYSLWLNPCKGSRPYQTFPLSVTVSQPIKREIRDFDETTFDSTAFSYYQLMRSMNNQSDADLLSNVLLSGEEPDIVPWLKQFNKKYKATLQTNEHTDYTRLLEEILRIGEKRYGSTDTFLMHEFVLRKKGAHIITLEERNALNNLFNNGNTIYTVAEINKLIYPVVTVHTDSAMVIGVTFNQAILRNWNVLRQQPDTGHVTALMLVNELRWQSDEPLKLFAAQHAIKRCQITGTEVLVNSGENMSLNSINEPEASFHLYDFPQLVIDSAKSNHHDYFLSGNGYAYTYHSALERFEGVSMPNARLQLLNEQPLLVTAPLFIVNNELAAGFFRVKLDNSRTRILKDDGSETNYTVDAFKQWCRQAGFTRVTFAEANNQLVVHFAKIADKTKP